MKVEVTKDFFRVDGTLVKTGDVIEVEKFVPELMKKVEEKPLKKEK